MRPSHTSVGPARRRVTPARRASWIRPASLVACITALAAVAALPATVHAQNLGPFRQFLSVDPYYAYEKVDLGASRDRIGVNAYGARLWINTAPFGATDHVGVSAFYTRSIRQESRGVSVTHYGAQFDIFPAHRPAGGFIDPFVSVGAGAFKLSTFGPRSGAEPDPRTHLSLVPGIGLRVPIPNRFELRGELRDAVVFGGAVGASPGDRRTTNNLEVQAGLGVTF